MSRTDLASLLIHADRENVFAALTDEDMAAINTLLQ